MVLRAHPVGEACVYVLSPSGPPCMKTYFGCQRRFPVDASRQLHILQYCESRKNCHHLLDSALQPGRPMDLTRGAANGGIDINAQLVSIRSARALMVFTVGMIRPCVLQIGVESVLNLS